MVDISKEFAGFSAVASNQYKLAQPDLLSIRTCCPVLINSWNTPEILVEVDATPHEMSKIGLSLEANDFHLAYPFNFVGQHINCLRLPKRREELPRIIIHTPPFQSLSADMDYFGHLFSSVPSINAHVVARGKAEAKIKSVSATIFADSKASIYADILGGILNANTSSGGRITANGEFMHISATAVNGSRVDTCGLVAGDYMASVDSGQIHHRGDIYGRTVTVPVITTNIIFYPK